MNTRFLFLILILFIYRAGFVSALFRCFDFGYVRYSIETPCFMSAVTFQYSNIADKSIANHNSLHSAFAGTLCFKHINVVNELSD